MSLKTTIGVVMMTVSGLYLFVVPNVNPASPHAYVPEFVFIGAFGVIYTYMSRNDKPEKSP